MNRRARSIPSGNANSEGLSAAIVGVRIRVATVAVESVSVMQRFQIRRCRILFGQPGLELLVSNVVDLDTGGLLKNRHRLEEALIIAAAERGASTVTVLTYAPYSAFSG